MASEVRQRKASAGSANADLPPVHPNTINQTPPRRAHARRPDPATSASSKWLGAVLFLALLGWAAFWWGNKLPAILQGDADSNDFAEGRAIRHVREIVRKGPHPLGSDALNDVFKYVLQQADAIQSAVGPGVEVDIDVQHVRKGNVALQSGLFNGRSIVYQNLRNIIIRVRGEDWAVEGKDMSGKSSSEDWHGLLVSSHIDSVFSSPGAGDCSSCIAVMLETLRALAAGPPFPAEQAVVFLFNEGEEEGLLGAEAFVSQHKWAGNIRAAIDLEAMGVGGKSLIFQAGPSSWLLEHYAASAVHPAGAVIAQDVFQSGIVKSATDFQIYRQAAGLSGLDFAYMENGGVYHTQGDAIKLLRPGSLQHSGDNLLALLRAAANDTELAKEHRNSLEGPEVPLDTVYFDLLGFKLIAYSFSSALNYHTVAILLFALYPLSHLVYMHISQGSLAPLVALLAQLATWPAAICLTSLLAYFITTSGPTASSSFGIPWFAGVLYAPVAGAAAVLAHGIGGGLIHRVVKRMPVSAFEASCIVERLQYWAASAQWAILLAVGTYYSLGTTYLALAWMAFPIVAFRRMASATGDKAKQHMPWLAGVLATVLPLLLSADPALRLTDVFIQMAGRLDRHPGSHPIWLSEVIVASLVAVLTVGALSYMLPYAHRGGASTTVRIAMILLQINVLSCFTAFSEKAPAYTADRPRPISAVQVVDLDTSHAYISIASHAPGSLRRALVPFGDKALCSSDNQPDFVTFQVKYGCVIKKDIAVPETPAPALVLLNQTLEEKASGSRSVLLRVGGRLRWALGIRSAAVASFSLEAVDSGLTDDALQSSHPRSLLLDKTAADSKDGWYIIQYSSGQVFEAGKQPTDFIIKLQLRKDAERLPGAEQSDLKVRVDDPTVTEDVKAVLDGLPASVTLFGKSTSPYCLAYTATLQVLA